MNYIKIKSIPIVNFAHSYSASDFYLKQFYLKNNFELVYYEIGGVSCVTKEETIVVPNKAFFIYNFSKNAIFMSKKTQKHFTINVSLDYENCSQDDPDAIPFPDMIPITDKNFTNTISNLIKECCRDYFLDKTNKLLLSSYVLKILALLKTFYSKPNNNSVPNNVATYVNQIKEYIHLRLDKKITIDDIANELNLSRGYVSDLFKMVEGTSIIRYINEQKLESIKNLVINENFKISDACRYFGFDDPNYVSRLYKKYYHTSIRDLKFNKIK